MMSKKAVFALAKALEGLPVLGALDGTPAARAGIRYGDVVVSVNGMRTRTVTEYVEAKNLRLDGMDLVLFRAGAMTELSLAYDATAQRVDPAKVLEAFERMGLDPTPSYDAPEGPGEAS